MENDPIYDYLPEVAFSQSEETLDDGDRVLQLDGELDMYISPGLRERLHEMAAVDGTHVVVDLTGARFIDTTVLETFVSAQTELGDHDGALAIVADSPYTRRTFELTGLDDVLRVSCSREEAFGRLH
jgi:anti-sigma B factor antagonist